MNINTDIRQHALNLYCEILDQVLCRLDTDEDFCEDLANVEAINESTALLKTCKKLMKDYFKEDHE